MKKLLRFLESAALIVLSAAILVTSIFAMRESLKSEYTAYDPGMLVFDPGLFAKKDAKEVALENALKQQENIIYDIEEGQRIELNAFITKFSEQNIASVNNLDHMSMVEFAARYHQIYENGKEHMPYEAVERIVLEYFDVQLYRPYLGSKEEFSVGSDEVYLHNRGEARNLLSIVTGVYVNQDGTFTCDFDIYCIADAMTVSEEYLSLNNSQALQNPQLTYVASGSAMLKETESSYLMISYTSLREGYCGYNVKWEYDHASRTLSLSGSGLMTSYSEWDAMPPWYLYAKHIERIVLSDEICNIGDYSFYDCQILKEINLPSELLEVGRYAFYGCLSLKELYFPGNVLSIDQYAFYGCLQLETVTFSQSLDSIGLRAFNDCDSLKSVTIPSSVSELDPYAFAYCDQLNSVFVEPENPYYASDEYGVLFDKEMKTLYQFPSGSRIDYTVPDGVLEIDFYAFQNAKLIGITLSDSVTRIERDAFWNCEGLKRVTLGKGIKTLGKQLFYGCYNLERFEVHPENPYFCNDENGLLWNADMTVLLQCPKTIEGEFTIPDCAKTIGESAFICCDLITGIDLNNVKKIESDAFAYCAGLTEIEIPDGVSQIPERCFSSCTSLNKIILPATISKVAHMAFDGCVSLEGVWFYGNMPQFAETALMTTQEETGRILTFYYLEGAEGWNGDAFEGVLLRPWTAE